MRNAWFAAGLMALILTVVFVINRSISEHVDAVLDRLSEVERRADGGDFEGAQQALTTTRSLWEEKATLLSMACSTCHTNEVSSVLRRLREQLACRDYKGYKSDNALLVAALEDMVKGLHISWESVM